MRWHWEPADVTPGTVVRSTTTNAVNAIFIIGYQRAEHVNELCLVDLADGLVVAHGLDAATMAERLNLGYRPYRLMLSEQVHNKFEKVT